MLSVSLRLGGAIGAAFGAATVVASPLPPSCGVAAGAIAAGAWLGVLSGAGLWFALSLPRWSRRTEPAGPGAAGSAAALIVLWTLVAALGRLPAWNADWSHKGSATVGGAIGAAVVLILAWHALAAVLSRTRSPLPLASFLLGFFAASLVQACAALATKEVGRGLIDAGFGVLAVVALWLAGAVMTRSSAWRGRNAATLRRIGLVAWGLLGAGSLAAWSFAPAAREGGELATSRRPRPRGGEGGVATNASLGDQALLTLGSEVRAVIPAPCPVDLAYPVDGARRVGLAWGMSGSISPTTAEFRAVLRTEDGSKHVLLDEKATSPGKGRPAWFSRVAELPPGTTRGEIVLRTRGTSRESFWAVPVLSGGPPPGAARRSVIVVSLDTVAASHLNAYGYEKRRTSPEIDAWAKEGTLFESAASTAPGTLSSQMSILTGRYPSSHGVSYANWRSTGALPVLPRNVPTLAEILRSHGFLTAAFTGSGYFALPLGFSRGFEEFVSTNDETRGSAASVFEKAFLWLEEHRDDSFFMFLHTYEAHAPYLDQRFVYAEGIGPQDEGARNEAMYDGDLARVDAYVGALRRRIQALGLGDHTLVLIVSDHGEEFGGHFGVWDDGHGHSLFQEVTHVPFVAVGPSVRRGQRIRRAIDLTAVAPSVLEFLGVESPQGMTGRPLMSLLRGEAQPRGPEWLAFSEDVWIGPAMRGVRSERWKLVEKGEVLPERFLDSDQRRAIHRKAQALDPQMLFDLTQDPGEARNLFPVEKEIASLFHRSLAEGLPRGSRQSGGAEVEVEGEALERLRALGYVQ